MSDAPQRPGAAFFEALEESGNEPAAFGLDLFLPAADDIAEKLASRLSSRLTLRLTVQEWDSLRTEISLAVAPALRAQAKYIFESIPFFVAQAVSARTGDDEPHAVTADDWGAGVVHLRDNIDWQKAPHGL